MEKVQKNEVTPREKLHKIFDTVDDEKVIAMFTLFQDLDKEDNLTYTDEFVAELDMDYDNYLNGGKTYTRKEAKTHTQELLKSLRKKNELTRTLFKILIPTPVNFFGTSTSSVCYMFDTRDRRCTEHKSNMNRTCIEQ